MRRKYGERNAMANGYRLQRYFRNEQSLVVSEINEKAATILDLACGSGLMTATLDPARHQVFGIDYNLDACLAARSNNLSVVRGNAFSLPVAGDSIDVVINCQFLNQQNTEGVRVILKESHRVLKPAGKLILVWRNDRAWIHRMAKFVFRYSDQLAGRPQFPHFDNYIDDVAIDAEIAGFKVIKKFLQFSLFNWRFMKLDTIGARSLGASCVLILKKIS